MTVARIDPTWVIQSQRLYETHDQRGSIQKVCDFALSVVREIKYGYSIAHRLFFHTPVPESQEQRIHWKKGTKGLCVFIHGLASAPTVWKSQFEFLKKHRKIDVFAPYVYRSGDCVLEEAAAPLLPLITEYAHSNPGKPICLLGVSNGSRIATWLETELRKTAPGTAVKVSTIAGVHFGTPALDWVEKWGIAHWFVKDERNKKDLAWGSDKAKELLQRVLEPLPEGTAERDYEFYASTEDLFFLCDIAPSLPCLNKGERFHVVHGYGHGSLVAAVAKHQIESCVDWIYSKHSKKKVS